MNTQSGAREGADGTVGKALQIMDIVADAGRPLRFSELQAASPLPKATLYRLVQTLTSQGMLVYDCDRQTYTPGLRLVQLAHAAWRQSSLAPIARPHIDALSAEVGETIHLAQLDRAQVLYVDKRNAVRPVEMYSQAGKVGPGYCTGVGKAMLAHLPETERQAAVRMQAFYPHTPNTITSVEALEAELETIRTEGVSFDREEHEPGIVCIAAPVLTPGGRVLGALSITTAGPAGLEGLARHRPALLRTAGEIAAAAETWQFPS
ncbi:IclR family transcriptional regulator [Allosediminivita pacifica]|uniref:IclR family transcriptional regulator n=1 Tax=Allosediminivita pacifica TaxID=1267769 RepID=A0A2T6B296_9RHOB|nr:IclR family transcriptional regulator [Allosediminivita pacifica]PTX50152.1 IclR family transcriptional regulator [Allosediminivita pacifica]GGB01785.1 IclR family transcriptional regulator [Allosediminivita pacifica]